MKKLSFMVAVLAIVFAVSSAFTSKKTTGTERWFYLDPAISVNQYASDFDQLATYNTEAIVGVPDEGICDASEPGQVCAVKILDADDSGFLESEELPSQVPASEKIVYKNE
jgi:Family of unknown function (DUF6520)